MDISKFLSFSRVGSNGMPLCSRYQAVAHKVDSLGAILTIVGDDQDRAYPIHRARAQTLFESTAPPSTLSADDMIAGSVTALARVLATVPQTLATVVVLLQQRVVRVYAHGNPAHNSADYVQVLDIFAWPRAIPCVACMAARHGVISSLPSNMFECVYGQFPINLPMLIFALDSYDGGQSAVRGHSQHRSHKLFKRPVHHQADSTLAAMSADTTASLPTSAADAATAAAVKKAPRAGSDLFVMDASRQSHGRGRSRMNQRDESQPRRKRKYARPGRHQKQRKKKPVQEDDVGRLGNWTGMVESGLLPRRR